MFVRPGDHIAGNDGREWLVCAVNETQLTLWNDERGLWTGVPSGSVRISRMPEDEAIENLRRQFPQIEKVMGATKASFAYYGMVHNGP